MITPVFFPHNVWAFLEWVDFPGFVLPDGTGHRMIV
jgi:hypothetical protein